MRNLDYIWNINEQKLSTYKRWRLRMIKRGIIITECIMKNNLMSYASALTYNCMLAAVPVFAIIFAIAKGFGFDNFLEERIRNSIEINPEILDTILGFVDSYLQHTKSGVFLGVGLVFLLYTLLSLTTNIETAFNTIWFVKSSRNIYKKITDYISVFILLPFIIIIISGLNMALMTFKSLIPEYEYLSNTLGTILHLSPVVLICIAFILLYKLMPNTHVKFKNVIVPGIVAGIAFSVIQYLYVHYQIKLSSYNAIYGSFAALPLFMLLLQISWSICLLGGQLCYANQCMENYAFERQSYDLSRRYRDTICLLLMSKICKRFANGGTAYSARTLARDTQLPETVVRILLDELTNMQLLVETHNEADSISQYLPAIDIHRMTLKMVVKTIDSFGSEATSHTWRMNAPEWERLRALRYHEKDTLLIDV